MIPMWAKAIQKKVSFDECAWATGKTIIQNAREADLPKEEIEKMKQRMERWVKALKAHESGIAEAWAGSLDYPDKVSIVRDMRQSREQIRMEIFGV